MEEDKGTSTSRARSLYQPEGTHPELRYQGKNRDVHRVVEVDAKKYTFTVVNDQEANTFRAASLVEQRMWLDHLPVRSALRDSCGYSVLCAH